MKATTYIFALLLAVLAGAMIWIVYQNRRPVRLFRKLVAKPIPASIKELKSYSTHSWFGNHTHVLKFNVDPEELAMFLAPEQFAKIGYVNYDGYFLSYGEMARHTHSFPLFGSEGSAPPWYTFREWMSYDAYLAKEEKAGYERTRLLLHNSDLNQAIFIDHQRKGTGIGKM